MTRGTLLALFLALMTVTWTSSCVVARPSRPPKPGPHFVWIAPHRTAAGIYIPGHWVYKGPGRPGRVWVPGHYGPDGKWIAGHWKKIEVRKRGVWVPGHYGPRGRWIPGHWK